MAKVYPYDEEPIKVPRFGEHGGFYTTKERSKMMSKIRAKNTKPELLLRRALWAAGLRYRVHVKDLPGKPDIALKKYRLAIFVDGEFWHGKNWQTRKPKMQTNKAFWIPKIERNMQKDRLANEALKNMGYTVFRFWGDEVAKHLDICVNQVQLYIETARRGRLPYRY